MTEAPPRVFISYSHDNPAHGERALALAERLRADGIDAMIDQWEPFPPESWPNWCDTQIRKADFVLMVCTEIYLRRVRGEEEAGVGLGVLWESLLINQHLYRAGSISRKFVPVLFANGLNAHVPTPVAGRTIYQVEMPEGYEALLRLLSSQPLVAMPPLGPRRELPTRKSVRSNSGSDQFALESRIDELTQLVSELERHLRPLKRLQELMPLPVYEECVRTMTSHVLKKQGYS